MTLGETLLAAAAALKEARIPSARLTAEVLLAHTLGKDRPFLHSHREDSLDEAVGKSYAELLSRRIGGEPLQYITGLQEFYGRPFALDRSVLIPRPETEFLVEAVLGLNRRPRPRILDVGTGSGCVATTLALELPDSRVDASDISLEAVVIARRNARALGADVRFACGDALSAWKGPYEIVVSNPPYVSGAEREGLQREVRDFEPPLALFGEGEPLDLYERLVREAEQRLVRGGFLALEIGFSMEKAVHALFGSGWELLETRADLQGIPRVVVARKR